MTIQALIFDFDGLILDTEVPVYRSWLELYQSFGCQLPPSSWVHHIGVSPGTYDPFASLEQQLGHAVDRASLNPKRRERELELIAEKPLQPGVESYLSDAKKLGLKVGLASSSSCQWVSGHLNRLGLLDYFDSLRTAEDVVHAKPDPALYLTVLEDLEVEPSQAIVLEDSPNGILAAKRAELFCVVVPNELTKLMPLDKADLYLESLADLSLEKLLSRVEPLIQ